MRRIAALLEKEFRQHLIIAVGLLLFLPFAYLMVLAGTHFSPDNITYLMTHTIFLWVFLPLTGLVLGNRLVVAEYHGRTQLFIEALPLRRIEMVSIKYLLGLLVLELTAACTLAVSALIAYGNEPVSLTMLIIMTARTAAYVFFLWSVLFTMGFLGRFRVPLYIALLVVLVALDSLTELDVWHFGPFALVDTQLALEREQLPVEALLTTLLLGAAFVMTAGILSLINEGSLAESLARRMTLKEKCVTGALFVAASIAVTALEERSEKQPFSFERQEVLKSEDAPIEIYYRSQPRLADAQSLMAVLEADLLDLRTELEWRKLPPIRVSLWETLDGRTFESVELTKNEGVLVRANFRPQQGWDERGFRSFLIERVLDGATEKRADFEPNAWVRDGYARYWSGRDHQRSCIQEPAACAPLLRALWLFREQGGPTRGQLEQWYRVRERHGEEMAGAMAYSGLLVLEQVHGPEAVTALVRDLYGRPWPVDSRTVVREWRRPLAASFREAVGVDLESFLEEWNRELTRLGSLPEVGAALDEIPRATATLSVERGQGSIRALAYRVNFSGEPPEGTRISLLHQALSPFDDPIVRRELLVEEHAVTSRTAAHRLLGRYGPGSRVFVAVEVDSPTLDCPLRLAAERREVR